MATVRGTISLGTTADTAAAGNDSRLSDTRNPNNHASRHSSIGADAVTIDESQVTNLTTDLAAKAAGAASSTDKALARFSGTGGKTLQNSSVIVEDLGETYGHIEKQNIQNGTTYTLQASDSGKVVIFTSSSGINITVPNTLLPGWHCRWEQRGTGQLFFTGNAVTPATLNNRSSQTKSAGQYAVGGLACYTGTGANAVVTLFGDTGA